jgi:hypothetical protein
MRRVEFFILKVNHLEKGARLQRKAAQLLKEKNEIFHLLKIHPPCFSIGAESFGQMIILSTDQFINYFNI